MAKCPECGKIWVCGNSDETMRRYYPPDDENGNPVEADHCGKCKCPDCRKPGDRMTIDEEYYGKKKEKDEFEMFKDLLDYADKSGLYDTFDDLELEWNAIFVKMSVWKDHVKTVYENLKKEGVIK